MAKLLPFLLFLLLSCAHTRPASLPKSRFFGALVPPPGFSFVPAANLPGESSALATFQGADGSVVKILETEEPGNSEASENMKSQAALIVRRLERQPDPYYGVTSPDSSCVNRTDIVSEPRDAGGMLVKAFRYHANRDFQVTACYGESYAFNVNALFLYCKNAGRLYSLRYFFAKRSAPSLYLEGFSCGP